MYPLELLQREAKETWKRWPGRKEEKKVFFLVLERAAVSLKISESFVEDMLVPKNIND